MKLSSQKARILDNLNKSKVYTEVCITKISYLERTIISDTRKTFNEPLTTNLRVV